jgi:protoheme IX farnesyltransferase
VQLLKPRVMSLVVFTALVGLLVAPGGVNPMVGFRDPVHRAGRGRVGRAEHVVRRRYRRGHEAHARRPVPGGQGRGGRGAGDRDWLSAISVAMLGLATNWLAAGLLAFTIFFYAVIYTMWLKRATPQNIVIGGAAGAFPPMIGWVAVTGSVASRRS